MISALLWVAIVEAPGSPWMPIPARRGRADGAARFPLPAAGDSQRHPDAGGMVGGVLRFTQDGGEVEAALGEITRHLMHKNGPGDTARLFCYPAAKYRRRRSALTL